MEHFLGHEEEEYYRQHQKRAHKDQPGVTHMSAFLLGLDVLPAVGDDRMAHVGYGYFGRHLVEGLFLGPLERVGVRKKVLHC